VHTSSMVAIYAVGMVAAVRLLRRGTAGWWMAAIAAVLCAGMLVLAFGSLLPAAALALASIAVTIVRRMRGRRAGGSDAGIPSRGVADLEVVQAPVVEPPRELRPSAPSA
jgi:amino acid efflux transporter